MSFFADRVKEVQGWFADGKVTEQEVALFLLHLKQGADTAAGSVLAGANAIYNFVADNGKTEILVINEVMSVVLQVASIADPRVALAVSAVNAFTVALNAVVAAKAANENFVQASIDAYKAFKNMQAASASATVLLVS